MTSLRKSLVPGLLAVLLLAHCSRREDSSKADSGSSALPSGAEVLSTEEKMKRLVAAENWILSKVGWSFGGLFFDADNDGYPDIYSASGYYTAPAATRSTQDL